MASAALLHTPHASSQPVPAAEAARTLGTLVAAMHSPTPRRMREGKMEVYSEPAAGEQVQQG